jgi:hypothetical protein
MMKRLEHPNVLHLEAVIDDPGEDSLVLGNMCVCVCVYLCVCVCVCVCPITAP